MKEYLKSGKNVYNSLSESSGRGFAFSMETVLSLLVCTVFITLVSTQVQEDFTDVLIYKQSSDALELMLEDGSLETHDVEHIRSLLGNVGLRGKITLDDDILFDDNPDVLVTVSRTMITKEGEYVKVTLKVGKK